MRRRLPPKKRVRMAAISEKTVLKKVMLKFSGVSEARYMATKSEARSMRFMPTVRRLRKKENLYSDMCPP